MSRYLLPPMLPSLAPSNTRQVTPAEMTAILSTEGLSSRFPTGTLFQVVSVAGGGGGGFTLEAVYMKVAQGASGTIIELPTGGGLPPTDGHTAGQVLGLVSPGRGPIEPDWIDVGSTHGQGAIADLPLSPGAGDTFAVTKGEDGLGDRYESFVDGVWTRVVESRIVYPDNAALRYDLLDLTSPVVNSGSAPSGDLTAPVPSALHRPAPTGPRAVRFPGNGARTVLTGASGYLPTTGMSLSLWFKRNTSDVGMILACKGYKAGAWGGPAASILLWINGTGALEAYVNDGTDVGAAGPVPTVGIWHEAVQTWDGRYLRLFYDGELVATTDRGSGGHSIAAGGTPGQWGIGGRSEGGTNDQQFNGWIAGPIIVTSDARSADAIESEYLRGLGWPTE